MKKFLSVLLAVMMVLSTVSFAIPTAVGTADVAAEVPASEAFVPDDESAFLAADETWYDTTKGTLLFNMDFDTDNDGNAVASTAYDGLSLGTYSAGSGELVSGLGRLNPDVTDHSSYDIGFRYTTSGSAALVEEDGNKYLSLNSSGSKQISLYLGNTYTKTGTYVFEYKYKLVSTGTTTANCIEYNTLIPTEGTQVAYTFDEWVTETAHFEVSSVPSYSRVIFYGTGNYSTSDVLYLDDIKVWYYDESVDYDEILGGEEVEVPEIDWTDDEKGDLLFTLDFDVDNDNSAVAATALDDLTTTSYHIPLTTLGHVNPDYYGDNVWSIFGHTVSGSTVASDTDGNQYLSTLAASIGASIYIESIADSGRDKYATPFITNDAGYYTLDFDYKVDSSSINLDIRYNTKSSSYTGTVGEWASYSYLSTTAYALGSIRMRMDGTAVGNTIEMDNIRLYYKPQTVSVTLGANGNADFSDVVVSDVSTLGVTASELLANVTNTTGRELLGVARTADGEAVAEDETIVLAADTTLYLVWGEESTEPETPEINDVWEDEYKGTKLFTIDFEAKNDGTALDSTSWDTIKDRLDNNPSNGELISDIGRINPDVADAESYRISFNYIDNTKTELVTEDGNTYLAIASDASHGDISLYVGGLYDAEGTYIIETSYKFVQTGENSVDRIRYETLALEYTDASYLSTGDWVDLSEVHEHSSCSHADVNRTRFTTADYNNTPFAADDRIYIDNITVYYQDPDFEAPADPEWTDETLGTKLFVIDLDGDTNYTTADLSKLNNRVTLSGAPYVEEIGRLNPDYAASYSNKFKYSFKDGGTPTVTGDTDKYFTHVATTSPSVSVGSPFIGAGTYTLVFNYETAKTFYAHSGYTGGTYTTTSIDDTWSQAMYQIDITEQISDDFFRIIATNGAGTYLIDDIALYYKNTAATVTVYANGNANVSDTVVTVNSDTGMTAAELVAKVDTSASAKELLGASLTADGELLAADYVVMPDTVSGIYLIWGDDIVVDDTPWWDDGYGTLLFNINWDGTLSSTAQTRWADIRAAGAVTNPDWKCFEKCYFMWGTEDIGGSATWIPATSPLIVAEANGNRYYTEPHNSTYNHWSVYSTLGGDWANWADNAGVFTVTYKIKTIGDITVNNLFIDPQTVKDHATVKTNIRLFATELPDSSGWTTVTYQFDLSDYDVSEGESLGHVLIYAQTNESSAVSGAYICYDDVKVYYKPSTVNVTLKPGTNLEVAETVVEASTVGVLASDLIALVDTQDTTMLATGIVTEDGSKKYALTDTVVLDADTTFVITWEENEWMDNELGMLIQKADFEGEFQTTTINRWPAATALGATINPDYDFEGVKGLQFTVANTGIAFDSSYMWIPSDYDVTENGNTYFEVPTANKAYGTTQQLTQMTMYAMGSGSSQYAYEGAGTYTITGKFKYGSDIQNAYFEVRPNLYTSSGLTGGYNYQFTDTVAGEWNDFSVTWSTAEDSTYGLGSVDFYLFYDNLTSASTIAFDDIMLYYKPFTAEITLRANNNPVAKDVVLSDVSTSGITVDELLSNIRTPLGGMDLVGLAYDKAGTNMLEGTVVVGGDARFFMIWVESELDPNAPVSENVNSIRTDDPVGMRFRAYMTTTVENAATQIGWVITRYDLLEAKDINPYDFYLDTEGVAKVSAYNKDTDGTNKIFGRDDTNTYITAVLYNIPVAHYETTLVARPFTVVDGVTYYGYPIERSICDVAEAVRDGGYAGCTNDQITYIMSILTACGKSTEPTVAE